MEKLLYTAAETAEVLNVSLATIWRMVERGTLPAQRLAPKVVRFRVRDVERLAGIERTVEYIEENTVRDLRLVESELITPS